MTFKVGDKVRRTEGSGFGPNQHVAGFEGVVSEVTSDEVGSILVFADDSSGYAHRYELVAPLGPVVTETVTVRRLEPGVYGLLRVDTHRDQMVVTIDPSDGHQPSASQMRELARVALEIAEYLDAQ